MEWLRINEKDENLGLHLEEILVGLSFEPYNTVSGWYRWYNGQNNTGGIRYGEDCVGKLGLLMDELSIRGLFPETYFLKSHSVVAGQQSPVEHFVAIVDGYIVDPFANQVKPIHLSDLETYGSIQTPGATLRRGFLAEIHDGGVFETSILLTPEHTTPRRLLTNIYYPQRYRVTLPQPREYLSLHVPFEFHVILDEQSPYKIRLENNGRGRNLRVFYYSDHTLKSDEAVEERLIEYYGINYSMLIEYFRYADSQMRYTKYCLENGIIK